MDPTTRKTKVVVTLAPSVWDTKDIVKMIDAGMNVARLDFKTGDAKVSYRNRIVKCQLLKVKPSDFIAN